MENTSNPGCFRMEGVNDTFAHSFVMKIFALYYEVPGGCWVL